MATETVARLKERAIEIRDEFRDDANTAGRVGTLLLNMIDTFGNCGDSQPLRGRAIEIRDESENDANTVGRVGTLLLNMIDKFDECCNGQQETYPTEITVEFTTATPDQQIANAVRLGTPAGSANGQARIDWGDGTVEDISVPPMPDNLQPTGFAHVYGNAGTYTVKVSAKGEVSNIRFSTVVRPGQEYAGPVKTGYLTKIVSVRSSALRDLNYMFAGQEKCANLEEGFILETPGIGRMDGTFYGCRMGTLPKTLLDRIRVEYMWYTFREMALTEIPAELLSGGIASTLVDTVDLFCRNPLKSIPDTLLGKCSKLERTESMFNACGPNDVLVKRELNAKILEGTNVRNISYMFAGMNRVRVEKNFLRYAANVENISGLFMNENYTAPAWGDTVHANDINAIFPGASYPKIKTMDNLFYNAVSDWNTNSFRCRTDEGSSISDFIAKFPNAASHGGCFKASDVNMDNLSMFPDWTAA